MGFLFLLDQLTKGYALTHLAYGMNVPIFFDFFSFQLVLNYGAAWGILSNQPYILLMVSFASFIGLLWFHHYFLRFRWCGRAVPFLLAGILGNGIDRLMLGFVVDFLKVSLFPVFNFADVYLTIAGVCLFMGFLRREAFYS